MLLVSEEFSHIFMDESLTWQHPTMTRCATSFCAAAIPGSQRAFLQDFFQDPQVRFHRTMKKVAYRVTLCPTSSCSVVTYSTQAWRAKGTRHPGWANKSHWLCQSARAGSAVVDGTALAGRLSQAAARW